MTEAFIYDAIRSPRGKGRSDGSLHEITPISLISQQLLALRNRNKFDDVLVDDVIIGCVSPVGEQGSDIARSAVLNAGFSQSVSGVQVNRFCSSGLEACNMAAAKVICGEADLMIAGGVECMSRVPMGSDGGAIANDPAVAFKTYFVPQGISADLIATKWGFSREDCDKYSVESQRRAALSVKNGYFKNSLNPVKDVMGQVILDHDEMIREGSSMETLASLKPAFIDFGLKYGFDGVALQKYPEFAKIDHVHHAGNSSGIVDGAAAVLIGNKEMGIKINKKPRAKFKQFVSVGSEPTIMLTGPELAAKKALAKAGMQVSDIDLWELNEAFASVVLRFMMALNLDHTNINVNGGAIAMGHPLGATGAMILGTVLDELERTNKSTALISLCIGAGMGVATIIERV